MSEVALILAKNLEAARLAYSLPPPSQAAFAKILGLKQRTYNRIARGEVDASLSTLEAASKALRLHPWQLLVADFNAKHPPELAPVSDKEREFYAALRKLTSGLIQP